MKKRPAIRWPFIALLVLLASITTWRLTRDPLKQDVRSFFASVEEGDAAGIMRGMIPEEISACGVTQKNLSQLWKDFLKPRYDLAKPVGEMSIDGASHTVVALRPMRYESGLTEEWGFDMQPTEDGGKTRVLSNILINAYRAEAQSKTTQQLSMLDLCPIIAGYIDRDRAYFESLGLKGVYGPQGGLQRWDEWANTFRAVAEHEQKAKANSG